MVERRESGLLLEDDMERLSRLSRLLGTATTADTVRSAVEFTLHFMELARSTRVGLAYADPAQLELLAERTARASVDRS